MIHQEGHRYITVILIIFVVVVILLYWKLNFIAPYITLVLVVIMGLFVNFFRNPERNIEEINDKLVYSAADGKVVAIEKVFEKEYFQSKRMQVSVFMSPLDVHINRISVSGTVRYKKYHPGKYLVAWHPKSSSENEHLTIVIQNTFGEVLIKQIAGAMARRIHNYVKIGDGVKQGEELGFIKFGSRVDLLLPLDSDIKVKIGDKVKGNVDVIAEI